MCRRTGIFVVCLILFLIVFGSILLSPWLMESGGFFTRWGITTQVMCRMLCHQDPDRSYHPGGVQMAVCHRCAGLYAGLILGLIIYPFTRFFKSGGFPSVRTLFILAGPMLVDVVLNLTGIWEGVSYFRTFTGLLIGVYLGLCIVNAYDAAFDQIKPRRT